MKANAKDERGLPKQVIAVRLVGLSDIMFHRFYDHSKNQRPAEQLFYLQGNSVVLPAESIYAFLFAQQPGGAAVVFEGKRQKEYLRVGQSHVFIDPQIIPFERYNQKTGKAEGISLSTDLGKVFSEDSQFFKFEASPRVKNGTQSVKVEAFARPVLKCEWKGLPWSVAFNVTLMQDGANSIIDEPKLRNWFDLGGILIGLCNGRPRFGRFQVEKWDVKE